MNGIVEITLDEAIGYTLRDIKKFSERQRKQDYGYDICPSSVARRWAWDKARGDDRRVNDLTMHNAPLFYDASWELCKRGILRPGVSGINKQAIDDGGYSLTAIGLKRLSEQKLEEIVILEPGSLAEVLSSFTRQYGEGFNQRCQEAIRCHQSGAWLACCAMVGAASESILLSLAIAKTGNEDRVILEYESRNGRRNVTNIIVGKLPKYLSDSLTIFLGLLAYWRDDAAHGKFSPISIANADEALRQLLHFAQWGEKNLKELTAPD